MDKAMKARLFARSLLIQSWWGFERMQGLGFAYCVAPWLARCYRGRPEEARGALLRHQEFFNTQPYMAALVAGTVCALEAEAARAPAEEREELIAKIRALKKTLAAALAGIGDALFWGALKPFCAALAAFGALVLRRAGSVQEGLWLAAVYLLAYNVPALWMRWKGLETGFAQKRRIPQALKGVPWQSAIRGLRAAASLLVLACCGLLWASNRDASLGVGALAAGAAFFKLVPGATSYRLYGAACLLGILASLAGRV